MESIKIHIEEMHKRENNVHWNGGIKTIENG